MILKTTGAWTTTFLAASSKKINATDNQISSCWRVGVRNRHVRCVTFLKSNIRAAQMWLSVDPYLLRIRRFTDARAEWEWVRRMRAAEDTRRKQLPRHSHMHAHASPGWASKSHQPFKKKWLFNSATGTQASVVFYWALKKKKKEKKSLSLLNKCGIWRLTGQLVMCQWNSKRVSSHCLWSSDE